MTAAAERSGPRTKHPARAIGIDRIMASGVDLTNTTVRRRALNAHVAGLRPLSVIYQTDNRVINVISGTQRATVGLMPRPYTDPVEIITAPVPAQSPFIPTDAKIVVGAVAPAAPDPIPIVLLPGFEYRMREWRHPDTHEIHWRLERRRAAHYSDTDD